MATAKTMFVAFAMLALAACGQSATVVKTTTAVSAASAKPRSIFDAEPASVSEAYPTTVEYGLSGIRLGDRKFQSVDPEIPEDVIFPVEGGTKVVDFRLLAPGRTVTSGPVQVAEGQTPVLANFIGHGSIDDAMRLLNEKGLRPATAKELIAFVDARNGLLLQPRARAMFGDHGEIIAMGTTWECLKDSTCFLSALRDSEGKIDLIAHPTFFGPADGTLFLAVPK